MLQIRLNKAPSSSEAGAGGGGAPSAKPSPLAAAAEAGVTVACPEHLILADLPVAKSLGAVTSSAVASSRSVSRRSRRSPGQKVHFCVRCDFPIAIYGRLIPCEHSFCLACARNDSSCYLCDERIQKIQTIKMMEGIYICAAPHCLKTFLKKPEFQAHVHEAHADLLHPNIEIEGANETEPMNIVKPSSADPHTQSSQPELSTARAPPRSGVSPSSNSQTQDREERSRRNQSRDQPQPKPPLQPRPPPQQSRQQPGDPQSDSNLPQGLQKQPQNWFHQPQNPENQSGSQFQQRRDADQLPQDKQAVISQDSSLPIYPPSTPQPPNYPFPLSANQVLAPTPSFSYPFPTEGSQSYYSVPEGGSEQGSVLGIPPAPTVAGFPDNFRPPWGMTLMGMPFTPMQVGQGIPEGFANNTDPQGRIQFSQGDYGRVPEALSMNPLTGKELEQRGGSADQEAKGMLAPMQMPLQFPLGLPPPPPLPPPLQQHPNSNFSGQEGQVYGWQNDSR